MLLVLYRCVIVLALLTVIIIAGVQPGSGETPEEAIKRIQAGQHTPMPPPSTAPATGPAGKGMTIENGTGHPLHIHFSGPVSRTVVVADGKSESVELAVGDYQVAAEVPGARITPFFGRHAYQPSTHYWLKFYTQRVQAPPQRVPRAQSDPPPAAGVTPKASHRKLLGTWEGTSRSNALATSVTFSVVEAAGQAEVTALEFSFACVKGNLPGGPLPLSSLVDLRSQRYPVDESGAFKFSGMRTPIVFGANGTGLLGADDSATGTITLLGSVSIKCDQDSVPIGGDWAARRRAP